MKALILAGGRGTRLMPLTKDIPKPMVKVAGKPMLEWLVILCKKYGISDIILSTHYLHEKIEDYFGDGSKWGVQITYSKEPEALGSAGAIKFARPHLTEDFVVLDGDEMINVNLLLMHRYHMQHGAYATVLVHESRHPYDSDLCELDNTFAIKRIFRPEKGDEFIPVNMSAVKIFTPEFLTHIPDGFVNLREVYDSMLAKGEKIQAYHTEEYVKDMGTHERLKKVEDDIKAGYVFGL